MVVVVSIVWKIPQKHHTIPAEVLPYDSEALLMKTWGACEALLMKTWGACDILNTYNICYAKSY